MTFANGMKKLRWLSSVAWTVVAVATIAIVLWGLTVASPSVVVDRQGFAEFGIAGGALTICLLLAVRRMWRLVAVPVGLFVIWSISAGWGSEVSRFQLGQGGPWFGGAPYELVGFIVLLLVATAAIRSVQPRELNREQGVGGQPATPPRVGG